MDFTKLFEDLQVKADNLDVAMTLLPDKNTVFSHDISELDNDLQDIKKLEKMVKESINQHNNVIKEEYNEVRETIQNVNEKMLFLLAEIEKLEPPNSKNNFMKMLSEMKSPAPKIFDRPGSSVFNELNTPRMSIDEYAKSPFRKRKLDLKFSDFEATISKKQFDKIPSYIRGRISLEDLQHFLELIIKCFNSKYELYYKNRSVLKPSDYSLQSFYKQQSSYFDGKKFITSGDLSRSLNRKIDKKDEKYIQCLRFLEIIKEARKNTATCYIWIEN